MANMERKRRSRPQTLLAIFCLTFGTTLAAAQEKNAAEVQFFESKVRPVLANRCYRCHGPEKQKAGLRLDSLADILKGGESGPALKVGSAEESLLIRAIRHGDTLQMPPGNKLPPREIADLTAWVTRGAVWPNAKLPGDVPAPLKVTEFSDKQRTFWAFQAPKLSPPPVVKNSTWLQSPIDPFILAELEKKGLTPAPAASRRVLVRRATFDLTGLPPTPAEVEAFVNDKSPDAFARLIDRLLDSPAYGERWGRHWLDVARYADSNGMDENLAYANAWRYRDYVVASFNQDKPYDQFVREQLAGDLLPADQADPNARLVATGFLTIGPKMLAEDDPVKMEMDIIDEQVDTIGRTFLGLTLGCARCHDHKFDPVSMADYYGLAGIFKSTRTMENFKVVARWHENTLGSKLDQDRKASLDKQIAEVKAASEKIVASANQDLRAQAIQRVDAYVQAALELVKNKALVVRPTLQGVAPAKAPGVIVLEAENYTRGNVIKEFNGYGASIGVIYNQGMLPNFAEYEITLGQAGAYQFELRYAAAAARPLSLSLNGRMLKKDAAGMVTGTWFPDTQTWNAEGIYRLPAGKNVIRLERAEPFPHIDKLALVPVAGDKGAVAFRTLDELAAEHKLVPVFLRQWVQQLEKSKTPPAAAELRKLIDAPAGPFALPKNLEESYSEKIRADLKQQRARLAELQKTTSTVNEAMGVAEGKVGNLRLHLRGNHLTLGAEVPRRFLQIVHLPEQRLPDAKQSGRLQLAEWITAPQHPLTARVMVNRVWHWHFGSGLVPTPDNFGLLGAAPVHQKLLDWLAVRFVEDGWSIKKLHRRIMLSSTYQMSGAHDDKAALIDPDNRLHWRFQRRRLEVEAMRDAMLAASGKLERTMGGSLLQAKNRAYVTSTANRNYDSYDSNRRSIYLPIIRSALYEPFQAFDFPDPSVGSGERARTVVAPQALFLMNSKFVAQQSRALADDLLAQSMLDDAGRVRLAYERAFSRPPSPAETARALVFLRRLEADDAPGKTAGVDRRLGSWSSLCRVLLSANEFIYLE